MCNLRQVSIDYHWKIVADHSRYWALFLGRPTGIKSSDLEMYRMSKQFACLSTCKPAGTQKSLETQIYEELLDLMELAGKIVEIRGSELQFSTDLDKANSAYLDVMNLDRQLQVWYRRLPENLVWNPQNIQTAPFSFFLLHQQYHCSLILLHRPWARYEDPNPPSSEHEQGDDSIDDNHAFMSRSICTRQAVRISRIFWHHRQRFDTRRIFVTGIQHAGTAATALVSALAFIKNPSDRKKNLPYLECLTSALQDMSSTYQPAASMSSILQAVMLELENANANCKPSSPDIRHQNNSVSMIPARRESAADGDTRSYKKRQLSKSSTRPSFTPQAPQSMVSTFVNVTSTASGILGSMSSENEKERNGYVMVAPQCERAAWPNLNSDVNVLDYPMSFTGMENTNWIDMVGSSLSGEMQGARNTELDFFSL